jgi:hypothetical protein
MLMVMDPPEQFELKHAGPGLRVLVCGVRVIEIGGKA